MAEYREDEPEPIRPPQELGMSLEKQLENAMRRRAAAAHEAAAWMAVEEACRAGLEVLSRHSEKKEAVDAMPDRASWNF